MGLLYQLEMAEYNINQIIELTGLSKTKCKSEINKILKCPSYSGLTYLKWTECPDKNKGYDYIRYIDSKLLNYFFELTIKPKDKNNHKKYRSYVKSLKVDYTITLTPPMNKQDNIAITEIIREDLRKNYGKKLITFEYNIELNPKEEHKKHYHTHLLLGFKCETDLKEVKQHFTRYLEEKVGKSKRIEINPYYDPQNKAGKIYFLKEGIVRLID